MKEKKKGGAVGQGGEGKVDNTLALPLSNSRKNENLWPKKHIINSSCSHSH